MSVSLEYTDDRVSLWLGDSLSVLTQLDTASVNAVITDPPYSSGGMVRGDRMMTTRSKYVTSMATHDLADFQGDNRDQRSYGYWCALWLSEALRITQPGGAIAMFTDWRQLPTTTDALQAGGWVWRGIVPWYKPAARPTAGRFTGACEYVVWGTAGALEMDWSAPILPGFYQAPAPREREHITQKPVDVMRGIVRICCEDGVILDPFMGAGTTGVAAVIEGRRFVGVEVSRNNLEVSTRRIREASGRPVVRGDQESFDWEASA